MDTEIRNSPSYSSFNKNISSSIRCNDVFNATHRNGLTFPNFICVGPSHLGEHKFEHNFLDTRSPICNCGFDIEIWNNFFLHCPRFTNERQNILHKIENIIHDIWNKDLNIS